MLIVVVLGVTIKAIMPSAELYYADCFSYTECHGTIIRAGVYPKWSNIIPVIKDNTKTNVLKHLS